jgi:hypothetical protein
LLTGDHHTAIVYTRRLDKDHPTMPTDRNPYKPPESMTGDAPLPATEGWEKSMQSTSRNAIFLGIFLTVCALALPHVMEWQALHVLREYGYVLMITCALLIANAAWGLRLGSDFSRIIGVIGLAWLVHSLWRTRKTRLLAASAP